MYHAFCLDVCYGSGDYRISFCYAGYQSVLIYRGCLSIGTAPCDGFVLSILGKDSSSP